MNTETLSCHPISVKGKLKYFGLNGNRGRIADIPLSVPNYTAEEQESHARRIVRACNSHEELVAALQVAAQLIPIARKYFPKSIKNSDRFQLENTCAAISKALEKAKGSP